MYYLHIFICTYTHIFQRIIFFFWEKTFTMTFKTGSKCNLFCIFLKNIGGDIGVGGGGGCSPTRMQWNYRNQGTQKYYSTLWFHTGFSMANADDTIYHERAAAAQSSETKHTGCEKRRPRSESTMSAPGLMRTGSLAAGGHAAWRAKYVSYHVHDPSFSGCYNISSVVYPWCFPISREQVWSR